MDILVILIKGTKYPQKKIQRQSVEFWVPLYIIHRPYEFKKKEKISWML